MNLRDRLVMVASSPAGRRTRIAGGVLLVLAGAQLGGGAGHALAAVGLVAAVPALLGTCA
jgi:outer membrane lipoprotein SlyB